MNHGIILHEEYRERMKKFSPERLGKLVHNMFLVDDGEEPESFSDDEALDVLSEIVCARLKRDIALSDKQRNNRLGITKQEPKKTKKNQTITKQEPKKTPITNNLLPITNNKDIYIVEIIDYLNEKTGKHFQAKGESVKYISGRLSEGYTVEDFKKVIDKKVKKWKDDPKMFEFLRPSTLFAPSHFDEYLNEPDEAPRVKTTNQFNSFESRPDSDYDYESLYKN